MACGDAEDIGNTQMMDDWATQIKTRFALDVEVDSKEVKRIFLRWLEPLGNEPSATLAQLFECFTSEQECVWDTAKLCIMHTVKEFDRNQFTAVR